MKCMFCGKNKAEIKKTYQGKMFCVHCGSCGATGQQHDKEENAVMEWETILQARCDHGADKSIMCVDFMPLGDVYMCECGALVDLMDERNYGNVIHAMTPQELKEQLLDAKKQVLDLFFASITTLRAELSK